MILKLKILFAISFLGLSVFSQDIDFILDSTIIGTKVKKVVKILEKNKIDYRFVDGPPGKICGIDVYSPNDTILYHLDFGFENSISVQFAKSEDKKYLLHRTKNFKILYFRTQKIRKRKKSTCRQ